MKNGQLKSKGYLIEVDWMIHAYLKNSEVTRND